MKVSFLQMHGDISEREEESLSKGKWKNDGSTRMSRSCANALRQTRIHLPRESIRKRNGPLVRRRLAVLAKADGQNRDFALGCIWERNALVVRRGALDNWKRYRIPGVL